MEGSNEDWISGRIRIKALRDLSGFAFDRELRAVTPRAAHWTSRRAFLAALNNPLYSLVDDSRI